MMPLTGDVKNIVRLNRLSPDALRRLAFEDAWSIFCRTCSPHKPS